MIVPTLQWKIHGENFMQNLRNSGIATARVVPVPAFRSRFPQILTFYLEWPYL